MIPQTLTIQNFLSYGPYPLTINFEPYRLMCLSGKNGHGKSAMLDAITWAMWGQARKVAGCTRSDEHLVRLGQDQMNVTFDFLCAGRRYRVSREMVFYSSGKTHQELRFGVLQEETNTFLALNEKSIRATQEKINSILGLDYDACINSIFLRQGQSNEFSKRSPQERKDVLASILGLDRYELIRSRALERARDGSKDLELQERIHAQQELELHKLPQLHAMMSSVDQELSEIAAQQKELTSQAEALESERVTLLKISNNLRTQRELGESYRETYQTITKHARPLAETWKKARQLMRSTATSRSQPQELLTQKTSLEARMHQLEQNQRLFLTHKEELLKLTEALQIRRHELIAEHQRKVGQANLKLQELESSYQREKASHAVLTEQLIALQSQLEKTCAQIQSLTQQLATQELRSIAIPEQKKLLERCQQTYHRWVAWESTLSAAITEARHIKALTAISTDKNVSQCPLCEQQLSHGDSEIIHRKQEKKLSIATHQQSRLLFLTKQLANKVHHIRYELDGLIAAEQEQARMGEQVASLRIQEKDLMQQQEAIEEQRTLCLERVHTAETLFKEAHRDLERLVHEESRSEANDPLMRNLTTQRDAISSRMVVLQADQETFKKTQAELMELTEQMRLVQKYESELLHQRSREEQIKNLGAERRVYREKMKSLECAISQLPILEKQLPQIDQKRALKLAEITQTSQKYTELIQKKGALENHRDHLIRLEAEHATQTVRLNALKQSVEDLTFIAAALGKNGVQALLIETSIPEIEQEANELLGKLTNNQSHIFIESVRDLKSGGTKETLDIKISDSLGIRPYELFSGGEAFRIDFALRIAISKLLARRSGTSLQTLIIDEGFGSQDEEGLANIMDALFKIQDDFEKIIVVSHLTAMKNQFPTHFIVRKEASGSSVSIIEQDL